MEPLNGVLAMSTNRRDFIGYPTNRVVGTVADADKAREAIDALLRAGFDAGVTSTSCTAKRISIASIRPAPSMGSSRSFIGR